MSFSAVPPGILILGTRVDGARLEGRVGTIGGQIVQGFFRASGMVIYHHRAFHKTKPTFSYRFGGSFLRSRGGSFLASAKGQTSCASIGRPIGRIPFCSQAKIQNDRSTTLVSIGSASGPARQLTSRSLCPVRPPQNAVVATFWNLLQNRCITHLPLDSLLSY